MRLPIYSVFDYFVSPSGSSGNTGLTSGSPWDWQTWITQNLYGRVTKFLNGTYDLSSGSGDYDRPILDHPGGSYEYPGVVVAETIGSVILSLGASTFPAIGQRYRQGCLSLIGLKVTGGGGSQYLFQAAGNSDASFGIRLSSCQSAGGQIGFRAYGGVAGILLDAFSATSMASHGIKLAGDEIALVDSPTLTGCNVGIEDDAAAGKTTLRSPTFSGCTTNRIGV